MQNEWSMAATRGAYIARQLPRLLWHVGHGYVMGRLAERGRAQKNDSERRYNRTNAPVLDRRRLYRDMAALFRTDLANVEAGLCPLPRDRDGSLLTLLDRSGLFFEDLPRVHRRRKPVSTPRCSTNKPVGADPPTTSRISISRPAAG